MKKYSDYLEEITIDELYYLFLSNGMFSDKVPPFFSGEKFAKYCISKKIDFENKQYDYVRYDTMRNINKPRQIGIPVPMAYERLCKELCDCWSEILEHFHRQTDSQDYVISRLHIQKRLNSDMLFEMNYDDWKNAGTPSDDLMVGNHYIVKTDISICFDSIYTHSIPWALVGKEYAKNNKKKTDWFNKIDIACRNMRYGETHGLLIGPHSSNLISEIILTVIDKKLYDNNYRFIRKIDDYTCYTKTKEEAERFLLNLKNYLSEFDLNINYKKTIIKKLPLESQDSWVRKLNGFNLLTPYGMVDYKHVQSYFDLAIENLYSSEENASIINYAIKVLSKQKLTENAKTYCWKVIFHFCLLYPYLLNILDKYVLNVFDIPKKDLDLFVNYLYQEGLDKRNFEECDYAIYYALKYDLNIVNIDASAIIKSNDCIYMLISYLYFEAKKEDINLVILYNHAKYLCHQDMDRYWLFAYEVLKTNDLKGEWKNLKKNKITFFNQEALCFLDKNEMVKNC